MSNDNAFPAEIPVLTDVVTERDEDGLGEATPNVDNASLIAELQTQLASGAYTLTEELLHSAFAELEATVFKQVTIKLRQELPELIDRILREHLGDESENA
jgi:hypothetical protein